MIRATVFNIIYYLGTLVIGVMIVPSLILPERYYLPFIRLYFQWVAVLEKYILGLNYVVLGQEHLPAGPYIIAAKHQSAYETLKLPILFNHPVVILKRELLAIPFWGWYAAKAGNIGINRSNPRQSLTQMVDGVKHALAAGRTPVIFPQGTRVAITENITDKPYKRGIAELYTVSGAPVVPMAVNSGVFWPRNAFFKRGGTVTFEFLPPIAPGLDKDTFMTTLEDILERQSTALVATAQDTLPPRVTGHPANIPTALAAALIFLYTILWFVGAHFIQLRINELWSGKTDQPFIMAGGTPRLGGFPGPYYIRWAGSVVRTADQAVMYTVPDARITFWPFPGAHLTVDLPRGLEGHVMEGDVQSFAFTLAIPHLLPQAWTKPEIQKLHDQNVIYRLVSLTIVGVTAKENQDAVAPLNLTAQNGTLWFDDQLQPMGQIEVVLTPVDEIKTMLMTLAGSHPMGRSFIGGALETLARVDPKTGEKILPLTFKLQNGKVYAGPIQVGYIGRSYWPVGDDQRGETGAPAFPRRTSPFTR